MVHGEPDILCSGTTNKHREKAAVGPTGPPQPQVTSVRLTNSDIEIVPHVSQGRMRIILTSLLGKSFRICSALALISDR